MALVSIPSKDNVAALLGTLVDRTGQASGVRPVLIFAHNASAEALWLLLFVGKTPPAPGPAAFPDFPPLPVPATSNNKMEIPIEAPVELSSACSFAWSRTRDVLTAPAVAVAANVRVDMIYR